MTNYTVKELFWFYLVYRVLPLFVCKYVIGACEMSILNVPFLRQQVTTQFFP